MRVMDIGTIQKLRELDEGFYRDNAASFSHTRQHAWPGWDRVLAALPGNPETVLDMACGNARFKSFLDERVGDKSLCYYGIDSCPSLLPNDRQFEFQNLDIIGALLEGTLISSLEAPACDLTACFGFMHHVPTNELRLALLDALVEKTELGGTLAISFWQFACDANMRERALSTTERGCADLGLTLDEGDFLLGWNDMPGVYRYCHSFSADELDAFIAHCGSCAQLVDRFEADGKNGQMNGYLVFRKK